MASHSKVLSVYELRPVEVYKLALNETMKSRMLGLPRIESSHVIGIEVEVESARTKGNSLWQAWYTENDGSLRNGGVEFISRPIEALYAPLIMDNLFNNYLTEECSFSPRTSVHIHLNAQDMTMEQVTNLVLVYSLFERLLFKYAGRGRMKNVYCVPLTECSLMNTLVSRSSFNERNWSKYSSLNLIPLTNYGTLEFRHMHGSRDVDKLSTWIGMICKIKDYILKTDTKTIRSTISQMDEDFPFFELLSQVFGDYAKYLNYSGSSDIAYLEAKNAMIPNASTMALVKLSVAESEFFNFKG